MIPTSSRGDSSTGASEAPATSEYARDLSRQDSEHRDGLGNMPPYGWLRLPPWSRSGGDATRLLLGSALPTPTIQRCRCTDAGRSAIGDERVEPARSNQVSGACRCARTRSNCSMSRICSRVSWTNFSRRPRAVSRLASSASAVSKLTATTPVPVPRLIIGLALQKPGTSSRVGNVIVLVKSMQVVDLRGLRQVARGRHCDQWSRCCSAISHLDLRRCAEARADPRAQCAHRLLAVRPRLQRMPGAGGDDRPVSRLASIDSPTHPSMTDIVGSTSSRTNSMQASIESGRPRNVLERAYMLFTSLPERRLWVAPQFAAHTSPAPAG